jgi:hypothetical protein
MRLKNSTLKRELKLMISLIKLWKKIDNKLKVKFRKDNYVKTP